MEINNDDYDLKLVSVSRSRISEKQEEIVFITNGGKNTGILHHVVDSTTAIIWVFGAGGGLCGPAGGIYERLADQLAKHTISSLRLDYRFPGRINPSVADVLLGSNFLKSLNFTKIILVGHSFGGAVVISAAAICEDIIGVAALSSQTYGTNLVDKLSPIPLLLIHGTSDEVLPHQCTADIYKRAKEPKEVIYYEGCKHGLDQCQEQLDHDLRKWIQKIGN